MESPVYQEDFKSYNAFVLILILFFLVIVGRYIILPKLFLMEITEKNTYGALFIGILLVIAATASFWGSFRNKVLYFNDRIEVKGGRTHTVSYREIKRVWKGSYDFGRRGQPAVVEKFPGSNTMASPWYSRYSTGLRLADTRKAQILVWNANTSRFGFSSLNDLPLVLELHNREIVELLHTKDEKKVVSILKEHAPGIEWSPVIG